MRDLLGGTLHYTEDWKEEMMKKKTQQPPAFEPMTTCFEGQRTSRCAATAVKLSAIIELVGTYRFII